MDTTLGFVLSVVLSIAAGGGCALFDRQLSPKWRIILVPGLGALVGLLSLWNVEASFFCGVISFITYIVLVVGIVR